MKKSIILVACLLLIPSFSAVAADEPEDFKFEMKSGIGLNLLFWNYRQYDDVVVQFDLNFTYYKYFTHEKIEQKNETIRTKICWHINRFYFHPTSPFELVEIHCEAFGDWDGGRDVHIWEYKVLIISKFSIVLEGGYVGPK